MVQARTGQIRACRDLGPQAEPATPAPPPQAPRPHRGIPAAAEPPRSQQAARRATPALVVDRRCSARRHRRSRRLPLPAPSAAGRCPLAPPRRPSAAAVAAAPPAMQRAAQGRQPREMLAAIRSAIEANRIDLYLQPIVTLPQRKVRFYEAMSRLRTENGDVVPAAEFISQAEAGGLMPKIDNLVVFRCVQVLRRLLLKNREVGVFCNLSVATLTDAVVFPQLLEFLDANRAIAPSLVLEFTQSGLRGAGPIENESLAALRDRGFHFSHGQCDGPAPGAARARRPRFSLRQAAGEPAPQPRRHHAPISIRATCPICSPASASTSSPRRSKARARWSICSITT